MSPFEVYILRLCCIDIYLIGSVHDKAQVTSICYLTLKYLKMIKKKGTESHKQGHHQYFDQNRMNNHYYQIYLELGCFV